MATTPAFASYGLLGAVALGATADNVYGASQPSHTVTVVSATTNGCKIDEVDVQGTGSTLAGNVTIWLYNGTTYYLVQVMALSASTVSATTPPSTATPWTPSNFVIPGNGNSATSWSLVASSTVASQLANVLAFGGAY